jgi:hypothetical protein
MNIPNPTTAGPLPDDDQTSLPGLPTWPKVYLVVAASFILWVVLLLILTLSFS